MRADSELLERITANVGGLQLLDAPPAPAAPAAWAPPAAPTTAGFLAPPTSPMLAPPVNALPAPIAPPAAEPVWDTVDSLTAIAARNAAAAQLPTIALLETGVTKVLAPSAPAPANVVLPVAATTKTKTKSKTKSKTKPKAKTNKRSANTAAKAPKAAPSRPLKRMVVSTMSGVAVVAMIVGGGLFAVKKNASNTKAEEAAAAAAPVAVWDPQIIDLAEFVEAQSGLAFPSVVALTFVTDDQFAELVDPAEVQPTAEQRGVASRMYNAWGLGVGFDPLAAEAETVRSAMARYDSATNVVTVNGTAITPELRPAVVRELALAMYDQHYSTGDRSTAAPLAVAAARRMLTAYVGTMATADRNSYVAQLRLSSDAVQIPRLAIDWTDGQSAAAVGYLDAVLAGSPEGSLALAFENPPSEESLVNQFALDAQQVDEVIDVSVPAGATVILEPHALSYVQMVVMLDAWLPWSFVRGALDPWQGGGVVSYERADGRACFTAAIAFDATPEVFANVLTMWATAAGSTAVPTITGNTVSFEACDRGPAAANPPDAIMPPMDLVAMEFRILTNLAKVSNRQVAVCLARNLADDPAAVAAIVNAPDRPIGGALGERFTALVSACGG